MKWKQILEKDALWFSLDVGFWYLPWRHYQERALTLQSTLGTYIVTPPLYLCIYKYLEALLPSLSMKLAAENTYFMLL
jgi:hypothetical protein